MMIRYTGMPRMLIKKHQALLGRLKMSPKDKGYIIFSLPKSGGEGGFVRLCSIA